MPRTKAKTLAQTAGELLEVLGYEYNTEKKVYTYNMIQNNHEVVLPDITCLENGNYKIAHLEVVKEDLLGDIACIVHDVIMNDISKKFKDVSNNSNYGDSMFPKTASPFPFPFPFPLKK